MDADGRFAGVVAISMDASRLPRNYGELDLGPGGGLALVGDDESSRRLRDIRRRDRKAVCNDGGRSAAPDGPAIR